MPTTVAEASAEATKSIDEAKPPRAGGLYTAPKIHIPTFFAWDQLNENDSHVRQASPVGSDTESLKQVAKANLKRLQESSARTLQLLKGHKDKSLELTDAEKKRLLCKENIQALQDQLKSTIQQRPHIRLAVPETRSALRSSKDADAPPQKRVEKHVKFAAAPDETFMTVPDVKSTLERHLQTRLRTTSATHQTQPRVSHHHGHPSKRHQPPLHSSSTPTDVSRRTDQNTQPLRRTRPRRLRRHPAKSSMNKTTSHAFLRRAPRKLVFLKALPSTSMPPTDQPDQTNLSISERQASESAVILRHRRRYPRRLEVSACIRPLSL
ncbi:hypothetical protein, variant 1 [Aphanomyces invadans]|uniref:Uncharacterized protein n=1 Tax=Aphanomyces invadans TaxID=157072 RepID=A0A024U4H3_9STRA|nr:hypothetical protein, variant 1 [Aphanomyces invadans]ETW00787.1 hypothetical protein, variant 1 [Aphanomyces invadans]|eukprot:XP_008870922.1 hypothetical protein, variant 1 [Aphanomyces invadans]